MMKARAIALTLALMGAWFGPAPLHAQVDRSRNMIENKVRDTRATPNEWRYVRHNGRWWYWTPNHEWIYHNGDVWIKHASRAAAADNPTDVAATTARPGSAAQPARVLENGASLYGPRARVWSSAPSPTNELQPYRYRYAQDPPPKGYRTRSPAAFDGPYENQFDLDPAGLTPTNHNQANVEDTSAGGQGQLRPLFGGRPGRAGSINGGVGTGSAGASIAPP